MGERLNLEIWHNGKVLANAYYHWSGYTDDAANVVTDALKYIKSNPAENNNILLYAIRALEATGAGLTDREIEYAKKIDCLNNATFAPCVSRNSGLIGISPDGIADTRYWQEEAARIFIDESRVSFRAFCIDEIWEFDKEQMANGKNIKASDLMRANWNIDDIKFNVWAEFATFLKLQDHQPFVANVEPHEVIQFIW